MLCRSILLSTQVYGLMHSLQGKHEESSFLQLELANARQSLDLIQASWQGDLSEVQVGKSSHGQA